MKNETIEFPPEWAAGEGVVPLDTFDPQIIRHADGGECVMTGVVFSDGTNIFVVAWDGGRRFTRTAAVTNWAIEERYEGRLVRRHREAVEFAWKTVMDSLVASAKETRRLLADPKCEACGADLDLDNDEIWTVDFRLHCETCGRELLGADELIPLPAHLTFRRKTT